MISLIPLALIGGIIYRARGGWPSIPRPFEQALFCLPVIYASLESNIMVIVVVYALSVAATLKGHGHTMNYSTPVDRSKLEDYEFFTEWLIEKIPDYWYKVIAHSFGGALMTLPLVFTAPWLALSGLLKGPAYMIGWFMHPHYDNGPIKIKIGKFTLDSATAWGEFLTGFFIWAALIIF